MCFVTKSAPHLELHWDHLLSPQKWRVMSLVSLTQHPKELLSLLIQVCRGRESKPKIRAVFTAKSPPQNCWFLPFSSPLKHQALAHCQLTASSEEVPLNSFGCFQIWSDHIMSLDRIIWMKKKFPEEEWMHQISSCFLRTLKLSACSTPLYMYLWSQAGFRHRALQRWVAKGWEKNYFFPLLHCHAQIRDILVLLTLDIIKFKSIHAAKKPWTRAIKSASQSGCRWTVTHIDILNLHYLQPVCCHKSFIRDIYGDWRIICNLLNWL